MRPEDLLAGLNPAQARATTTVRGPVCVLAGAGSGKTRTITRRIAYQVAAGVAAPGQVLAVTFTDRAAAELRTRLAALGVPGVRAATFHAAAWAQLRYFLPRLGGRVPEVLPSKLPLLVPLARQHGVQAADLAAEIEWAKARGLDPAGYAGRVRSESPLPPGTMAELFAAYEARKAAEGRLDYEDMLLRAVRLLEDHPEVAACVRDRYRCFTVDEFQDVNPAQHALLRAWLGERRDLCVVGDPDQTIYTFTGATSRYLTGFPRAFPGAAVIRLAENYRSSPQILALANRVLAAGRRSPPGRLVARNPDGPAPTIRGFHTGEAEVAGVIAEVRRLLDAGVPPAEIAVCYRVNAQSQPYEEALAAAGVAYTVAGDGAFFDRPEVSQALAALDVEAQRQRAEGLPPPDPADLVPAPPPRTGRQVEAILRRRFGWHPRREPRGRAARERWRNLSALAELAGRLDDEGVATLPDLVERLREQAAQGASVRGGGAVTLLTLHRAKGLEFDAVLLVGLEESVLPIRHATTPAALDEERRLLYVGVTRARRHLWLSWAESRRGRGDRVRARRPSRFVVPLLGGTASGGGRRRRTRITTGS